MAEHDFSERTLFEVLSYLAFPPVTHVLHSLVLDCSRWSEPTPSLQIPIAKRIVRRLHSRTSGLHWIFGPRILVRRAVTSNTRARFHNYLTGLANNDSFHPSGKRLLYHRFSLATLNWVELA